MIDETIDIDAFAKILEDMNTFGEKEDIKSPLQPRGIPKRWTTT
jgi:hypothetical protein